MTQLVNRAVADRAGWLVAGVEHACAVLRHQAAELSKAMRRNRHEPYSRLIAKRQWPLRLTSRVTPDFGANLKSP